MQQFLSQQRLVKNIAQKILKQNVAIVPELSNFHPELTCYLIAKLFNCCFYNERCLKFYLLPSKNWRVLVWSQLF